MILSSRRSPAHLSVQWKAYKALEEVKALSSDVVTIIESCSEWQKNSRIDNCYYQPLPNLNMPVNEREQLDSPSTQSFLSSPITPPKPKPQKADEIAVQLSFSFACSNAFKLLIAFALILAVGWNAYVYITENDNPIQPTPAASPGNSPRNP